MPATRQKPTAQLLDPAQQAERLAGWEKHEKPKASTCCGKPFKDENETDKQWTGYCSHCGQQHIVGYPASTYTSDKPKSGRRGSRSSGTEE